LFGFLWLFRCHHVFLLNSGLVYPPRGLSASVMGLFILLSVACPPRGTLFDRYAGQASLF
jgi:hypothetical protein